MVKNLWTCYSDEPFNQLSHLKSIALEVIAWKNANVINPSLKLRSSFYVKIK